MGLMYLIMWAILEMPFFSYFFKYLHSAFLRNGNLKQEDPLLHLLLQQSPCEFRMRENNWLRVTQRASRAEWHSYFGIPDPNELL